MNVADQYFSCLDGRVDKSVLGSAGGDGGEFLVGLHVYEILIGRAMNEKQVEESLRGYVEWMRPEKFYMCTDEAAIEHLEKDMGMSMTIESLRNPKQGNQKDLLNYLLKADNNGDLHFKRLLKSPWFYGIRPQLVHAFIKAFYSLLWDKASPLRTKLILDSLQGDHQEQAFLEIRSNTACKSA